MSVDDLNSLRPGDRIVYATPTRSTRGIVKSIWRGDLIVIAWGDEKAIDTLIINDDTARHLERPQQ